MLKIPSYIFCSILLICAFIGYGSLNYFYLYGHIESFSDFVFCVLQWTKLAGLSIAPAAIFLKSKRLKIALKYVYPILPLITFFWFGRYFSVVKVPKTEAEQIYLNINTFIPIVLLKTAFIVENISLSLLAIIVALSDKYSPKAELKQLKWFGLVFLLTTPLNIFKNFVTLFSPSVYSFFYFKNFSLWHFLAFFSLFGAMYFVYRLLKNKTSYERYRYLKIFSIILLVQYMSRASMLVGDGYNMYKTIFAFIPLFVCSIGVLIACLAIFTRNKYLSDMAFFIHAPGALSVFVYFGKPELSDFGTVFDFTFLYFVIYHTMLFIISVIPVLLKEQGFKLKRCVVPLIYFAVFITSASAVSQIISAKTYTYGSTSLNIYPNFSFTQDSPIAHNLPLIEINILGLKFDVLYLSLLFSAYIAIFFAFYTLSHIFIKRFIKPILKNAEDIMEIPDIISEAASTLTDNQIT